MAFPKKNRRNITVNGQKYFWFVKGTDDGICIRVSPIEKQNMQFVAYFDYEYAPITTACIREVILYTFQEDVVMRVQSNEIRLPQNCIGPLKLLELKHAKNQ